MLSGFIEYMWVGQLALWCTMSESDDDSTVTTWRDANPANELGPEPEVISLDTTNGHTEDEVPLFTAKTPKTDVPWRPNLQKAVVSFVACCVFLIIFLVFLLGMGGPSIKKTNDATKIRQALMMSMMDTSANPCDDAYDYTCGTYNSRYLVSS